jgi:uncharacterized protein
MPCRLTGLSHVSPPEPPSPSLWSALKAQFKAQVPEKSVLVRHRWLRPIAHRLEEPGLWHMRPEAMARGVAIGLFWAFAVPFAQIIFAAANCVWWRANIPVAAAITFITNPFTIGGWLWLAYQVGSLFVAPGAAAPQASGWLGTLQALGWPTVVGMALFAVGGSLAGYIVVRSSTRLWFHWRVLRRSRRQRAAGV